MQKYLNVKPVSTTYQKPFRAKVLREGLTFFEVMIPDHIHNIGGMKIRFSKKHNRIIGARRNHFPKWSI